jgi:hypothetical protein
MMNLSGSGVNVFSSEREVMKTLDLLFELAGSYGKSTNAAFSDKLKVLIKSTGNSKMKTLMFQVRSLSHR